MLNSYFFIPASRLHKINDIIKAAPNKIIIDFEDAILKKDIDSYFKELKTISNVTSYWFRIPIRNDYQEKINFKYIDKFKEFGVRLIVLPKIKSANELIEIVDRYKELNFIILIEHPRLLQEMSYALMQTPRLSRSILGVGLGSHDLMTYIKADHFENQLDYPRKKLLYIAKAYNLIAIDIASMNIFRKEEFDRELLYANNNGYDGKFIIHPRQLTWLQKSNEENTFLIEWAQMVMKHLPKNYNGEDIAPFVLNNEVIEKPHALRALELIKKHNYGK